LIYGAGSAGIQLSSALEHTFEYKPVGFIDNSLELEGSQIRGLLASKQIHNTHLLQISHRDLALCQLCHTWQ
jgi:FlaA1/EpsC-like NDP-sugar epimerase